MEYQHSENLLQQTSTSKLTENFWGELIVEREDDEHISVWNIARNIRIQYNKKGKRIEWKEHKRAGKYQEDSLYWHKNEKFGYDEEEVFMEYKAKDS